MRRSRKRPKTIARKAPPDAFAQAARALAIRELLLQEARRLGLKPEPASDGEGRRETDEEALIRAVIESQTPQDEPDEESCRRFYEQQPCALPLRRSLRGGAYPDRSGANGRQRRRSGARSGDKADRPVAERPVGFCSSGAGLFRLHVARPGRRPGAVRARSMRAGIRRGARQIGAGRRFPPSRPRRFTDGMCCGSTGRSRARPCRLIS